MKTKEEFIQVGQELHKKLKYPGMEGVNREGVPARFFWNSDTEVVIAETTDGGRETLSVSDLLKGINMAVADRKSEPVEPLLEIQAEVMTYATLLPLRREKADQMMDSAISQNAKVRRLPHIGSANLNALATAAVDTEESARDAEFGLDIQYAHYEVLAEELEATGSLEGVNSDYFVETGASVNAEGVQA